MSLYKGKPEALSESVAAFLREAKLFFPLQLQSSWFPSPKPHQNDLAPEKHFSLHRRVLSTTLHFSGNVVSRSLLQIVCFFYNLWKVLKTCHNHTTVNLKAERHLSILCIIRHTPI